MSQRAHVSAFVDTAQAPVESSVRLVKPKTLKPNSSPRIANPHVERIAIAVAAEMGVTYGQIMSESRHKTAAKARAISMHVARLRYGYSSVELGRFFGRDHTSVLGMLRKAAGLIAQYPGYAEIVSALVASGGTEAAAE